MISPNVTLPAFLTGFVWAIADISWFVANDNLSLSVRLLTAPFMTFLIPRGALVFYTRKHSSIVFPSRTHLFYMHDLNTGLFSGDHVRARSCWCYVGCFPVWRNQRVGKPHQACCGVLHYCACRFPDCRFEVVVLEPFLGFATFVARALHGLLVCVDMGFDKQYCNYPGVERRGL